MSGLRDASDEALLEAFRAGELIAFDVLYARYERPLFGFVVRLLDGDRAEAEDVLHQVFLSVLREAKRGDVRRVKAWLYEAARNAAANRRRSVQRGSRVTTEAAASELPDEALLRAQTGAALQAALARLPSTLTEVWALRAAGLSYDEAAKVLGVPLGTVKSRLHEVVTRLREEMAR